MRLKKLSRQIKSPKLNNMHTERSASPTLSYGKKITKVIFEKNIKTNVLHLKGLRIGIVSPSTY